MVKARSMLETYTLYFVRPRCEHDEQITVGSLPEATRAAQVRLERLVEEEGLAAVHVTIWSDGEPLGTLDYVGGAYSWQPPK